MDTSTTSAAFFVTLARTAENVLMRSAERLARMREGCASGALQIAAASDVERMTEVVGESWAAAIMALAAWMHSEDECAECGETIRPGEGGHGDGGDDLCDECWAARESHGAYPVGTKLRGPHPVTRETITVEVSEAWDNWRVLYMPDKGHDLCRASCDEIDRAGWKLVKE